MTRPTLENRLEQAKQLITRLERVSADSVWAHRSSGYRGSLLKWIDGAENKVADNHSIDTKHLAHFDLLYPVGLDLLTQAAREGLNKRGIKG